MLYLKETDNALNCAVNVGSYSDLVKLLNNGSDANTLNQQIGFTYIKKSPGGYRSTVKTDSGLVVIYFDQDNQFIGYQLLALSDQNILEDIRQLEIGMSITKVRSIDANARYSFLFSGSNQVPKISFHVFPDGNAFEIFYNEQLEIVKIFNYVL